VNLLIAFTALDGINRYGRTSTLTSVLSGIVRHFNRWRLVLSIFLLVYSALLLLDLGYAAIQWDETSHLYNGLLLSRGHLQEYIQEGSFYPPLFDVTTALYFKILGLSVFSARLVAVTFGVLSVWCVFEYAYRLYGPRNALVSSVLLASMPGFIVLCRMALIEIMLVFFFSISLLLFFSWLHTNNDKMLLLSGVTLGLGFLVKYQILVGGIIMLVSVFFLWRERILAKLGKFSLLLIIAGAFALPWIFFTQKYASGTLEEWLYVLQVGNEERLVYSKRFPLPIFYIIEMTYPYMDIHPISLPIYILALLGLGFWLWRRRREDKFSLIWFFVVYSVFTLIPNKNWRYVTPVFPILAVAASDFILFIWDKAKDCLRAYQISLHKKSITKVGTAVFVFLLVASVLHSSLDAYSWVEKDHVHVHVEEASRYVAERSALNETVVVLCTSNFFRVDMVKFYLQIYNPNQRPPWQYPELPVDAYMPIFNETTLIERSEALHVRYLLLYEYGNITFFQSEWRANDVLEVLLNTDRFAVDAELGNFPRRIFIMRFSSTS
jgi:hypothetical protein